MHILKLADSVISINCNHEQLKKNFSIKKKELVGAKTGGVQDELLAPSG